MKKGRYAEIISVTMLSIIIQWGVVQAEYFVNLIREITYVDASNTGYQDGTLENPYSTISQALATGSTEIRVAEGVYTESLEIYDGLSLKGGYDSGTWLQDWQENITTIVGQDWSVIRNSESLTNNIISGFHITGTPLVTTSGIDIDSVSGMIMISDIKIYELQGPDGMDGEHCALFTPECPNMAGASAPDVYGIHIQGTAASVHHTIVTDLSAGNGGLGGWWEYAAGHINGGSGGSGGSVTGINITGPTHDNIISNLTAGNGNTGGNGWDDTGYGGHGAGGGTGGDAIGLKVSGSDSHSNTLICNIRAGNGGMGGGGTWHASPAAGSDGGNAIGFQLIEGSSGEFHYFTVDTVIAGHGGPGGNWTPYSQSPDIRGGHGGYGGYAKAVAVGGADPGVIVDSSIVVNSNFGFGGTGGFGEPNGFPGESGYAYGMYGYYTPPNNREITLTYNNVWNHGSDLYYGTEPGAGDISADPQFASGQDSDHFLSQIAAGQTVDSPCVNAGDPAGYLQEGTTRTDLERDSHAADLGYHHPLQGPEPTPTPQPCVHNGDVNADDSITPEDALECFQIYLTSYPDPTYEEYCSADCDGNNLVTPADALCIFRNYINGSCECVMPAP